MALGRETNCFMTTGGRVKAGGGETVQEVCSLTCCSCKRNRWKSCRWTAEASGRSVFLSSGKETVFREGHTSTVQRPLLPAGRLPPRHAAKTLLGARHRPVNGETQVTWMTFLT